MDFTLPFIAACVYWLARNSFTQRQNPQSRTHTHEGDSVGHAHPGGEYMHCHPTGDPYVIQILSSKGETLV
jgi:hypothetical protein